MSTNSALVLYSYLEEIMSSHYSESNDLANIIWVVKKGKIELDGIGVEWFWDKKREFVTVKDYQVYNTL